MQRILSVLGTALVAMAALAGSVHAAPISDQVQEDWEVVIGNPNPTEGGPQIATGMSPVSDDSSPSFVLNLNYRDFPSFDAGGMQVQIWNGDQMLSADPGKGTAQCNTSGESISWTQTMKLSSGKISLAIDSGKSTTWGKFGQGNQLSVSGSFATSLTSFANHSPETSVANSGVPWQRNCVTSMKLVKVRYYLGGKLVATDSTVRTIDLSN
jgi:hypothetical protein